MTRSSKSIYSRFIPREEIDAVSTWRFANVDGSPHPDEIQPPQPLGPSPDEIEAMLQAARAQGFEEGHAKGLAEGIEQTRASLEAPLAEAKADWVRRFDALLSTLEQQLSQMQEEMAQSVLDIACDLARQVLRRELASDTAALLPVVQEALAQLSGEAKPVTIRLHPDDLASLESVWADTSPAQRPQFVADSQITPGGCLVEAPGAGVDATVEKRWRRAIANLGLSADWESNHESG